MTTIAIEKPDVDRLRDDRDELARELVEIRTMCRDRVAAKRGGSVLFLMAIVERCDDRLAGVAERNADAE
jgi:hypothetical protein